jgi:hypothetical protein
LATLRRSFCGYVDTEGLVADLREFRIHGPIEMLRDLCFVLNEAKTSLSRSPQMVNEWMIVGTNEEQYFIVTATLRILEKWVGVSCDEEISLMRRESDSRGLVVASQRTEWAATMSTLGEALTTLLARERWRRICVNIVVDEDNARTALLESYRHRCQSIVDDISRLHRLGGEIAAGRASSRSLLLGNVLFSELLYMGNIDFSETTRRDAIGREERCCFRAVVQANTTDIQLLRESEVTSAQERALSVAYMSSRSSSVSAQQRISATPLHATSSEPRGLGSNEPVLWIGPRVVSPDLVRNAFVPQDALLAGRMQDVVDDQLIERHLLEDDEGDSRLELLLRFRGGDASRSCVVPSSKGRFASGPSPVVRCGSSRSHGVARHQTPAVTSVAPSPAAATTISRPLSVLLAEVLYTPEPPKAKYGVGGASQPNIRFMPKVSVR